MANALVSVRCPACRQVHAVPADKVGTAFTCPGCRAAYVIPASPSAPAANMPAPPPLPAGPRPPHLASAPPIAPPPPPGMKAAVPEPVLERVTIDPQSGRLFGQVLAGVALGLVGLTILAAVAVPLYYFRARARPADAASTVVGNEPPTNVEENVVAENNPDQASAGTSAETTPAETTSAGKQSGQATAPTSNSGSALPLNAPPPGVTWVSADEPLGVSRSGVRVRVLRAEYGAVMARDEHRQPIPAGPGDFLKVYLQIENRTDADLPYVSWYGNHFAAGGKKVMARLWDDTGKPYPQHTFNGLRGIQGHTPTATISKTERLGDVLIFSLPASTVRNSPHTFRLELPGGALRNDNFYRFHIPRSMLSEF